MRKRGLGTERPTAAGSRQVSTAVPRPPTGCTAGDALECGRAGEGEVKPSTGTRDEGLSGQEGSCAGAWPACSQHQPRGAPEGGGQGMVCVFT